MRVFRPKHYPQFKSSHLSPLKVVPPLLCPPTKEERSWGESISETRRLVRKVKREQRRPEGVGASVRAKILEPPGTARKTSPLPQTNRIRYRAVAVRVGRGMLISVLNPLPGVAEQRIV